MLQYRVDPRTKEGAFFNPRPTEKAVPAQYGVYLHGTDTYWHRTVGPNFLIDLGNWPTEKDAEAFVEHLKANGPDSHGRFVLNTYSNKNIWLDSVRRVTNGNNKQKQIVGNEWHGIPGVRNNELRLEQIYRARTRLVVDVNWNMWWWTSVF